MKKKREDIGGHIRKMIQAESKSRSVYPGASKKASSTLQSVGHELKMNPPRQLAKTQKKYGSSRAEKQRKAILLSKARKRGANV